jgi:predicted small integral membrane protein
MEAFSTWLNEHFAWMAWTWPTAILFILLFSTLAVMTVLAVKYPEKPRIGVLRIATTRGDRLFITLVGSSYINLAWLGFQGPPLWGALGLCLLYAVAVFRFV